MSPTLFHLKDTQATPDTQSATLADQSTLDKAEASNSKSYLAKKTRVQNQDLLQEVHQIREELNELKNSVMPLLNVIYKDTRIAKYALLDNEMIPKGYIEDVKEQEAEKARKLEKKREKRDNIKKKFEAMKKAALEKAELSSGDEEVEEG